MPNLRKNLQSNDKREHCKKNNGHQSKLELKLELPNQSSFAVPFANNISQVPTSSTKEDIRIYMEECKNVYCYLIRKNSILFLPAVFPSPEGLKVLIAVCCKLLKSKAMPSVPCILWTITIPSQCNEQVRRGQTIAFLTFLNSYSQLAWFLFT